MKKLYYAFLLTVIGNLSYSMEENTTQELPVKHSMQSPEINESIVPYDKDKHKVFLRHIIQHNTIDENKTIHNQKITDEYIESKINSIENVQYVRIFWMRYKYEQHAKLKFQNNLPIGFISYVNDNEYPKNVKICNLVILPNYRRKGYASELINSVINDLIGKYITISFERIDTYVTKDNPWNQQVESFLVKKNQFKPFQRPFSKHSSDHYLVGFIKDIPKESHLAS